MSNARIIPGNLISNSDYFLQHGEDVVIEKFDLIVSIMIR